MTYLKHHGIKGQKWGVRNGPPYPIEDKVLRKGTRLNSVSLENNSDKYLKNAIEKKRAIYTYNPNDKWDSDVYKGPFSVYKTDYATKKIYEHKFEVVEDLKMPTKQERVDEFINLYRKYPSTMSWDLYSIKDAVVSKKIGNEKEQKEFKEFSPFKKVDKQTGQEKNTAYKLFNHAMENVSWFTSTKRYMDIMSKKYDAMVDDNNQGVYNKAHDPVIIMNTSALKVVDKCREVSVDEISEGYINIKSALEKENENIKL